MSAIKINRQGIPNGAKSMADVVVALSQDLARRTASAVAALTDNSAGTPDTDNVITGYGTELVNVANSGGNLAIATTASSEIGVQVITAQVRDAIGEVLEKADAILVALGLHEASSVVDNSGRATPDGTIGAIDLDVGTGATGVQATETNVIRRKLNNYLYTAAKLVNKVALATGVPGVSISIPAEDQVNLLPTNGFGTIAAFGVTNTGTSASPGVAKAQADLWIGAMANDVATLAAVLNAAANDTVKPKVLVAF